MQLRPLIPPSILALAVAWAFPFDAAAQSDEESSRPLAAEVVYKADVMANVGGSQPKRSAYHGNLDLKLSVDGERAYGLKGNSLFLYVLNNHGGHLSDTVQALQGIDNIEVEVGATRVLQAWMEQRFADDRYSVLVGLYDLNSEFYATESSGVFINPSFGIGPDMAQTGENGPSIFPVTSLAIRGKARLGERGYVQAALFDAVPGDPDHPRGTHVRLNRNEGVLWVVEGGVETRLLGEGDGAGKLGLGLWGYSERSDDLVRIDASGDPRQVRNNGAYLLVDQPVPLGAEADKLRAFLRVGVANKDANPVGIAWQAGVTYEGLFGARESDVIAFGVASAQVGAPFKDAVVASGGERPRDEMILELSYRAQVNKHVALQPDIQYIVRHVDPAFDDVLVLGVRVEVSF